MRYVLFLLSALCGGCATLQPPARVVSAGMDNPDEWFRLGNRYAEDGRLDDAEHAYRQALQHGPHPKAQHNLGLVQVRLGIEALQQARMQLPPDHPVHATTREFLQLLLRAAQNE